MICTALANLSCTECLDAVKKIDFAELRFDLLDLSDEDIRAVVSANSNVIATCRPGKYPDDDRKRILLCAIASGAAYIDVEVEASDELKQEIIDAARAKGAQIIMSYHNFDKTPERAELEHIVAWCGELAPDIIKIACMVNSARDNARLIGLLDTSKRLLVVGMGEQGKISRVISPLLGSFCTFASYSSATATAPGQLFKQDMESVIDRIKHL